MGNLSLLVAFSGGLLSFLSPCVLPLVPVYLATMAGPEILERKVGESRLPIFLHSLCFVGGFSFVFIAMGTIAGLTGFAIGAQPVVHKIAGGLLIAFGIFMLAALKIPWLNFEKRLTPSQSSTTGYLRSILIGAIFSVAWTPCVGPILGSILALALDSATTWQGTYLLAFYSLGLGVPFLIMGIAFDFMTPALKKVQRYSNWIYLGSAVILITVGILILTTRFI
jgi:cytochrome c-type biogenesis protein